MKKLTILLIIFAFSLKACSQDAQTFESVVTFKYGFRFTPTGTIYLTMPSGGSNDWLLIAGKPQYFPVDLAPLDLRYKPISYIPTYVALPDKPPTMDLAAGLLTLPYMELRQYTTAEINALVIPSGKIVEVFDKTLGVKKVYVNGVWKTYILNQ